MQLNEQLAQRIVDRAQKIIKYPLNVMDVTGIIIASSNPARKYQKHGGAVLALSELKPIEISSQMLPEFPNAKAGVNLPIIFNGEAIGVIGISGPLLEVRPFGEMVKMAAEMVVEYASMMEKTRWSERKQEEFLLEWIESTSDFEHISNLAAQLKINIYRPHTICIIEVENSEGHKTLNKVLNAWSRKRLKAEYSYKQTIVLLNATEQEYRNQTEIDDWKSLSQHLSASMPISFSCSCGDIYVEPKQLPYAFASSLAVMSCGQRIKPSQNFYSFNEYELPALFEGRLSCWQQDKLATHAKKLEQTDPSLITTLLCWFENNCDNKSTSSALYIHPNTLRYRLKRVEEICQIDIHSYKEMCHLYFSLIL